MAKRDLSKISKEKLRKLPDEELRLVMSDLLGMQEQDRRQNALWYYKPAHEKALSVHKSNTRVRGLGGGNGSSKTETMLAEMLMYGLGICPLEFRDEAGDVPDWWKEKFRGPVHCRVVVESLTTTLHTIILEKLRWWKWTGHSSPGGEKGHWGWVPKEALIAGDWDKSWSEKLRQLTVLCRDPEDPSRVLGETTFQFMSHDQDATDFASGDYHWIGFDEPPNYAIWRECQARTMRVKGMTMLAMTWSDDPAVPQDWIDDEIYDRAQAGPNKHPDFEWTELYTTDNPHLDQEAVAAQAAIWDEQTRLVRLYGGRLRHTTRIHKLFTDVPMVWCFACGKTTIPVEGSCGTCRSSRIIDFCHVDAELDPGPLAPAYWVIDPHPRKPHMFAWIQVTPADDYYVRMEGEVADDPVEVANYCDRVERELGLEVVGRLMDPNMGASPTARREINWREEFEESGLRCDLADRSDVGRKRVNEYLKPDERTKQPRLLVHPDCTGMIHQMKRFSWDNYRVALDRDVKQSPRSKDDDYPAILRYLMNLSPTYQFAAYGPGIVGPRRTFAKRKSRLDDLRYNEHRLSQRRSFEGRG